MPFFSKEMQGNKKNFSLIWEGNESTGELCMGAWWEIKRQPEPKAGFFDLFKIFLFAFFKAFKF